MPVDTYLQDNVTPGPVTCRNTHTTATAKDVALLFYPWHRKMSKSLVKDNRYYFQDIYISVTETEKREKGGHTMH